MMKMFVHHNPVELHFGPKSFEKIGNIAQRYGKKALLVTGKQSMRKSGILDELERILGEAGIDSVIFDKVEPNPSYSTVEMGAEIAISKKCDMVIGCGGGSAMDAAKAIAIASLSNKRISSFFEGEKPSEAMPVIEIATTAGTGSEVDRYFVLTNPETKEKNATGFKCSYPAAAIVDPTLMKTMPPRLTAATGIDAFFHGLESYVSKLSTPISELYAKEAMQLIINNLYEAFRDGENMEAREKMALASTLAGLAIDISRTTLLHALEHPVSGHLNAVHGEGLAALSIAYMEFTLPLCPEKFANVATLFGEDIDGLPEQEAAMKSIDGMRKFLKKFGMDIGLRELGVNEDMIDVFVEEAGKSPISKTNPRPASPADMREIYLKSL